MNTRKTGSKKEGELPVWVTVLVAILCIGFGGVIIWYGVYHGMIQQSIFTQHEDYGPVYSEGWGAIISGGFIALFGLVPLFLAWIVVRETFWGDDG